MLWISGSLFVKNITDTIANLALAWILAQGDFINLLSGSTTVDQIAENVKSAELELDSADVAMMRDMVEATYV